MQPGYDDGWYPFKGVWVSRALFELLFDDKVITFKELALVVLVNAATEDPNPLDGSDPLRELHRFQYTNKEIARLLKCTESRAKQMVNKLCKLEILKRRMAVRRKKRIRKLEVTDLYLY